MATLRPLGTALALLLTTSCASVFAQEQPTLTVISSGETTVFERSELEDMGLAAITTRTPWNDGVIKFEGVPLTVLLDKVNAVGETAVVTALNDYSVDVPVADFAEFGTILAIKRDGEYMPVDDQGPFFIVYPYDSNSALQGQPYYGRSVWQVKQITVQ